MIDATLRELVWQRAEGRCEYCRLPQYVIEATFHVEHILARQHSPPDADSPDNLALACHQCNVRLRARGSTMPEIGRKPLQQQFGKAR